MATEMKPGIRLTSAVCETEVVVVRAPTRPLTLECGGYAMDGEAGSTPKLEHSEGTLLGKRYMFEEAGLEVLCVKPGDGSLSVDGKPMSVKEAKQLPSSD